MKIDKSEYKRVINGAGHLEYELRQYIEKNRETAAKNLKQTEMDEVLEKDTQQRSIKQARKR